MEDNNKLPKGSQSARQPRKTKQTPGEDSHRFNFRLEPGVDLVAIFKDMGINPKVQSGLEGMTSVSHLTREQSIELEQRLASAKIEGSENEVPYRLYLGRGPYLENSEYAKYREWKCRECEKVGYILGPARILDNSKWHSGVCPTCWTAPGYQEKSIGEGPETVFRRINCSKCGREGIAIGDTDDQVHRLWWADVICPECMVKGLEPWEVLRGRHCSICGEFYWASRGNERDYLCRKHRGPEWKETRRRVTLALNASEKRHLVANLTFREFYDTLQDFQFCCAYCHKAKWEILDHFVKPSEGGGTTKSNCVPACKKCTDAKNHRSRASSRKFLTPNEERVRDYLETKK